MKTPIKDGKHRLYITPCDGAIYRDGDNVAMELEHKKTPHWQRYGEGYARIHFMGVCDAAGWLSLSTTESGAKSHKRTMVTLQRADVERLRDMCALILEEDQAPAHPLEDQGPFVNRVTADVTLNQVTERASPRVVWETDYGETSTSGQHADVFGIDEKQHRLRVKRSHKGSRWFRASIDGESLLNAWDTMIAAKVGVLEEARKRGLIT